MEGNREGHGTVLKRVRKQNNINRRTPRSTSLPQKIKNIKKEL